LGEHNQKDGLTRFLWIVMVEQFPGLSQLIGLNGSS